MNRQACVLVLALLAFGACRDSTPPEPLPRCASLTDLTVSAGTTPTFQWSGACGVNSLFVRLASTANSTHWSVSAPDTIATIGSPITYGQVPSGGVQGVSALPLAVGTEYRATITIPSGPGFFTVIGAVNFTP